MSEKPTPEVPEAFLREFPKQGGEKQKSVDKIPEVLEIKSDILEALEGRWTDDRKAGGRSYNGSFKNGQTIFNISQIYADGSLYVNYERNEGQDQVKINLRFVHEVRAELEGYQMEGTYTVTNEAGNEADRIYSKIESVYEEKPKKTVTSLNTNAEEGLKFAGEARDALARSATVKFLTKNPAG